MAQSREYMVTIRPSRIWLLKVRIALALAALSMRLLASHPKIIVVSK